MKKINERFLKGISNFIRANKRMIKIPLKEFLYYVYHYRNEYPDELESKLKNLRRDWDKGGFVRGFATAFNVYNKLKTAKNPTDLLPMEEDFYKLKSYYNNSKTMISATMTLDNIVFDNIIKLANIKDLFKVDTSKLAGLKIGELSKAGTIAGLFLTPVSTVTQEQEDKILSEVDNGYKSWEPSQYPQEKQNNKKDKSGTLEKTLPFASATAGAGLSALSGIVLVALSMLFLSESKKRK